MTNDDLTEGLSLIEKGLKVLEKEYSKFVAGYMYGTEEETQMEFTDTKNFTLDLKTLTTAFSNVESKEESSNDNKQCQNWFAKFRSGDFSLKDEKCPGRLVKVNDDLIKAIIDSDRRSTTREIAEKLHVSQLGYVQKLDTWVPHELKETHLTQRINSCNLLKKHNENDPFLKRGDEKWVVYNNIKQKRSWSRPGEPTQTTSKADIHQKKVLLSVWWDYKGIVYFELLLPNRTINSDVYIEQLTKLNDAVEEKRPKLTN
ncbi:mariner Mos1 transposase [Trichonephila clavipes]|nr:mariner Mos1 transposase [Trichonephila clavipes]